MPRYYPLSLQLEGKAVLVVGGGAVAERKVLSLLEAGAQVQVVSPTVTPVLQELADANKLTLTLAPYDSSLLPHPILVFAATDSREVNAQVAQEASAHSILVNVVDAPEEGDFITPAVVRRGDFCLSISTGGNHPLLTKRLCEELESRFGPEYGDYVELLGRIRNYIKGKTKDTVLRRKALASILDSEASLLIFFRDEQPAEAIAYAESLVDTLLKGE